MNACLRELGLGQNNIGNDGAVAIADALRCTETLERPDLCGNTISDEGATAILKASAGGSCSLTWMNLEDNDDISSVLWTGIHNARVFNCSMNNLLNPLEEMLIPLVVQALHQDNFFPKKPRLVARRIPAAAVRIFYLARTAPRNDSNVVEFPPPANRGWWLDRSMHF
jgi:Leucine Rich repeat